MKIKLTVSYDGTNYCGWQVQPNGITVQQVLEDALFLATGERTRITGSGRTDAGVHAQGQVAHFETKSSIPPEKFYKALNARLPEDIKVIKSELADDDFHACNTAKKKTYTYSLYMSEVEKPLRERYAVRVDENINIEKMKEVAKLLVGEHDFKAFCASGSGAKTSVRTIYNINIENVNGEIKILVTGNGFLYNMVRIIVGTLIGVSKNEIDKADVQKMLTTGKRPQSIKTLSSKGLCLTSVEY